MVPNKQDVSKYMTRVHNLLYDMNMHIENFSQSAENCNMVEISIPIEQIGESIGSVEAIFNEHVKDKEQLKEFQSLYGKYEKAREKLRECECTKKY